MNIVMASVVLMPTFASTRPACALSFGSIRAVMYAVLPTSTFPFSVRRRCITSVIHIKVRLPLQEIEVAAFVGLGHALDIEAPVAARGLCRRRPGGAAPGQLAVVDGEIEAALGRIEGDDVAVAHQRQRAAGGGF